MFASLLQRLTGATPDPLPDHDAKLALSALLVRIARSDGDYAHIEVERIERILRARYDLSADEANELRHSAELFEETAPDTVRFTRAIKEAVPYEDRESVVEAAWEVVLVDGARADEEDALMRMIASLLGVNDRDSNIARQRAQKAP
ncbi:TerB family tellurite resistance protein [Aliiroseovarius subalbicans]|uniref:tellurite resistance TerB family protein n=1 Tax=Aliiroseovarius subalbicans TaxID=2925840 RepID=UPI001F5604DD|nr:TerB family tellurite resistance protein [Aliiroseovarius subalbicans]MCI2397902.1 TerB family tellurite resistance protein [Aliiroseovarius subalbicans]